MVSRILKLSSKDSFFLFGARGVGKSYLLEHKFKKSTCLWIDFLDFEEERAFRHNPNELSYRLSKGSYNRVVIDEIQKVPKLLDIIQKEMRKNPKIQFIMTGSSARKLKRDQSNLLAGRAFTYYLYPLTTFELKDNFDLAEVLNFGSLPGLLEKKSKLRKSEFLRSYVHTYMKEEIRVEQLIRNFDPFQAFLEVAAQQNGKIINYSNIADDVQVNHKTVANYFTILEDTLLGFMLPSYHKSVRKQQRKSPKFYFFDTGLKKALDRTLNFDLSEGTYAFGAAFEHWVIAECFRLNEYLRKDFKFSYLRSKDGVEIDLIIERPMQKDLLIEIKSSRQIKEKHTTHLCAFQKDWKSDSISQIWSLDKNEKNIKGVDCVFWKNALKRIFTR